MKGMVPGSRIGPYEIVSFIGAGGMGEVYRARDPRLERSVAIKVLPETLFQDGDAVLRFEREARATAAVSHPNLIAIHDVGRAGDIHYLVMDLLEGETLRQHLAAGPVPLVKAVEIAIAIADGVGAVHAKGFIHRDVKPENIFITTDGWVKLLDFGLAIPRVPVAGASDDEPTMKAITRKGTFVGSLPYMAPEQLRGEEVDGRADVFAVGAVLYEMLSGKGAFRRPTPAETIAAILSGEMVDFPPSVPSDLSQVVRRCLERAREHRFQSAADLGFALRLAGSTERPTGGAYTSPTAPANRRSIAVLPFANLSGQQENEFFADGISEELISALASVPGLQVASRTSSFAFKGKAADVRVIGEQLNVTALLEGSVRRAGDRIRISTQLINVADGYQMWSQRFDRQLRDIFAIQDEITATVVEHLRAHFTPAGEVRARHPQNIDAYTKYLRGLFEYNRATPSGFQRAIACYTQATEAEPGYALAHSGLALVYGDIGSFGLFAPSRESWEASMRAAVRALEIDDSVASAHAALAWVRVCHDWNWKSAEEHFRRAIDLDPGCAVARHFFAHFFTALGRNAEAREQSEVFHQIGPLDPHASSHLIFDHLFSGDLSQAIQWGERDREIYPEVPWGRVYLGMAYLRAGRADEAVAEFSAVAHATGSPWALSHLAGAHAATGRTDEAGRIVDDLIERRATSYVQAYDIALALLALGRHDEALTWLEIAADERNHWFIYIAVERAFDPIRRAPRFRALLDRAGLR